MLANSLIEIVASSLASGLSIEASSYPKPGNVSPLGGAKGLEHWFFLSSSTSIAIELYKILQEVVETKGCLERGLGEKIYKVYSASSKPHGGGNVSLGFTMLVVPIAIGIGDLIRHNDLGIISAEEVLKRSVGLARICENSEDSAWISRAILEASPSYIFRYRGQGYDILGDRNRSRSFWGFVEDFRRHDLILNEIWSGYKRVYRAYNIICSNYPYNLYEGVVIAFITIGSQTIDTLIARKKGYKVAMKVKKEMGKILSLIKQGSCFWKVYAEILDKELKASQINPGSIADIVATAAGLCVAIKTIERIESANR
ncbi:MAG: triphosphoribosyl-dephospho-CoA synthase [Sulfolobales archaeon]